MHESAICSTGTAFGKVLHRRATFERLRDSRFESRQILQQLEFRGNVVKRLVGALRLAKPARLAEPLHCHAARIHEHERLHAVVDRTPISFIGAACRLGNTYEQARSLDSQNVDIGVLHILRPIVRQYDTKCTPDLVRRLDPLP